jgi:hypothetical protein
MKKPSARSPKIDAPCVTSPCTPYPSHHTIHPGTLTLLYTSLPHPLYPETSNPSPQLVTPGVTANPQGNRPQPPKPLDRYARSSGRFTTRSLYRLTASRTTS